MVSSGFPYLIYHTDRILTHDIGDDLRHLSTSLTQSLCDQIFTQPIHWTLATQFPETATHAIDFGPGGLSGIGPLTARNLEGRGVRVLVVGEKGKGGAELYDSREVKYEQWWEKKWAPALVKTRFVSSICIGWAKVLILYTATGPSTSILPSPVC